MSEISEKELITLLKKNKLKITPQRLAICKLILSSREHPSAEMILNQLKNDYPMISLATIYKTITLLKNLGLVVELSFHNGHSRFDPNVSIHVNIICPICGKITDYESESVYDFYKKLESDIGGNFTGQRFDFYKKCQKCKK